MTYVAMVRDLGEPQSLEIRVYEAGPRGRLVWSARRQRHYVAVTNRGLTNEQSLALIRTLISDAHDGAAFERALKGESDE